RVGRVAHGREVGSLEERPGLGMRRTESLHARAPLRYGGKKLHEVLWSAGGKAIVGVRDHVGAGVAGKEESYGKAALLLRVVRTVWHADEVREPRHHRRGRTPQERRARERGRWVGGNELSLEEHPSRVHGSQAAMDPEQSMEALEEVVDQRGGRHGLRQETAATCCNRADSKRPDDRRPAFPLTMPNQAWQGEPCR